MRGQFLKVRPMELSLKAAFAGLVFVSAPLTARGIQPRPATDLQVLPSIDCLEARLKDPTTPCDDLVPQDGRTVRVVFNMSQVAPETGNTENQSASSESVVVRFSMNQSDGQEMSVQNISLFNFPDYKAPVCRNNDAPICDPYGFLSDSEGKNLSLELAMLRSQHLVVCDDLISEPIDQRHLQPFYVGVAIAQASGTEMSQSTLRQYGHLILSEWNMDESYAANGQLMRCPNQALLLIVPDRSQAVLVTDSCHYTCEEQGAPAPKVVTKSLHTGTVADAVLAGVRSVYASLPNAVAEGEDMPARQVQQVEAQASSESNAETWVLFVQRAIFAFAVMALGFSLLVGLLVMCFAPGLAKGHRGYT
ncbi:unnamed protein product [Symbiodinium natans]|uniref:Transmembrane protein n=1 Tax=Symbiodinium natans TaxID=878477 RepID=A0A812Q0N5_9DINO|nr:unnamed protein product [Symbiodinium natans]